jgi:TPR repeat protein
LYNLGNAYTAGTGVQVDIGKAISFYEAAIKTGDPDSKFTLGTWLYKGIHGVAVDKTRSFQLHLEAADAGHAYAMFNIGAAYMEGAVVTQDFQTAAIWFEKAADKGVIEANLNLGKLHRTGMGVPRDLHKAVEIFARFADRHELSAQIVELVKEEIKAEEQR